MTTHKLKTWPKPFEAIWDGRKTYELRKADRFFKVGDILQLQWWDPKTQRYDGREILAEVTFITEAGTWGLQEGYCALGIKITLKHGVCTCPYGNTGRDGYCVNCGCWRGKK